MKTYAVVRYNDSPRGVYTRAIDNGVTWKPEKPETHIGSLTTKFEVTSSNYPEKYCFYMGPTTYKQVPGGC